MNMEELILSLPSFIEGERKDESGMMVPFKSGLCVKFLHEEKVWCCRYGTPRGSSHIKDLPRTGFGVTPKEAVEDLIRVIREAAKK